MQPLIVDAHLDLSWNALSWNRDLTEELADINRREAGMTDDDARGNATVSLPEMRRGNVGLAVITILARAKRNVQSPRRIDLDYATQDIAYAQAQGQLAYYHRLIARNEIRLLGDVESLEAHLKDWDARDHSHAPIGCILSMEGCDPMVEPSAAGMWWRQGLRIAGLGHYGQCHYAMGTGGDGPLTSRAFPLLAEFERLGMIVDLTHTAEPGFFQVLDHFAGPVLASHNNCRALVPGDRQFSDQQIRRLIARGAVIGTVLDAWMLRPGWIIGQSKPDELTLESAADHVMHICNLAGNTRHVAIGSDLDGGFGTEQSPGDTKSIADLQNFAGILSRRGFSDDDIRLYMHGNWLRYFRQHLPRHATIGE